MRVNARGAERTETQPVRYRRTGAMLDCAAGLSVLTMAKILVAYYSLTGHAERVAKELASRLGADLEPIRDEASRQGAFGHLRSIFDVVCGRSPAILPGKLDASQYDLVILGAPVWAQSIAAPMRTYAKRNREKMKNVAVYCTEMGEGGERALNQLKTLCGKEPRGTMIVLEKELQSGAYADKIGGFLKAIAPAQ